MATNILRFPLPHQQRRNQWDHTVFDLGVCVHPDCDQSAMFYIDHRPGAQPSLRFTTGEHAQRMKRVLEEPLGGDVSEDDIPRVRRAPLVCAGCAMGALAAVIAYGT